MLDDYELEEIKKLISYSEDACSFSGTPEDASAVSGNEPDHSEKARIDSDLSADTVCEGEMHVPAYFAAKRRLIARSVPFLICFSVLSILSWCIPLRETVSLSENRNLTEFPAFSASGLISGEWFSGIGDWYADTFPFRSSWISLGNAFDDCYGHSSIALIGDITLSDTMPLSEEAEGSPTSQGYSIDSVLSSESRSEQEESDAANVNSASLESETVEASAANAQKELDDIDIDNDLAAGHNIIVLDGSAYPVGKFSQYYTEKFAGAMNNAAELLDGRCRVFLMPAFQSTCVMLSRSVRDYCRCPADEDTLEYMFSLTDDGVYCVNTYEALAEHNSEYIYFHSDHHWTALGAYYAYLAWTEAAGVEPVTLDRYEEMDIGESTGTYYVYSSGQHPVETDRLYAYDPPGDIELNIVDTGGYDSKNHLGFRQDLFTRISTTEGKYRTFLCGDHALCTLTNNDIDDDSAVLIVKDSYGNALGYYYTQHYKHVYLIDYRKYTRRGLQNFVDEYGIDDIIFAMSLYSTQTETGANMIKTFVR